MAKRRSRTVSVTRARRHTQICSLPKSGSPTGTSARRYPTPWQYGQFGSPGRSLTGSADELLDFVFDVVLASRLIVSSTLLFGTSLFLPASQDCFTVFPAAFVMLYR